MPPHGVGLLCPFGLKTGVHFANFGLESGMVFGETTGVYERTYRFNFKQVRKKERKGEFEMDLMDLFVYALNNLSNDNIIFA